MSNKYDSFKDYWREVQETAKRYYDWAREGAEEIRTSSFDPDGEIDEVPTWAIVDAAVQHHDLVTGYKRTTILHCENGFYDSGGERYFDNPEDQNEALEQLALAAFHNDILDVIHHIESVRESLGEALNLIEGPIYGEGVTFSYDYKKGLSNPTVHTYTFKCLSGDEWRVYDPDGAAFEVISPQVIVEQSERPIEEYAFELFLNNLCAKRENELENE